MTNFKIHIGKYSPHMKFLIEFLLKSMNFSKILLAKKDQMSVVNSVAIYEALFICVWNFFHLPDRKYDQTTKLCVICVNESNLLVLLSPNVCFTEHLKFNMLSLTCSSLLCRGGSFNSSRSLLQ